jgi:chemotaxis protein CheX
MMPALTGHFREWTALDEELLKPYLDSVKEILQMMAGVQVFSHSITPVEKAEILSYGVSSILTFSGGIFTGRIVLDLPPEVALKIANSLLGENFTSPRERMVLASICEINNTIAGNANTVINNKTGLSLRLSPPYVLTGERLVFASTKSKSVSVMFKANIGFFRMYLTLKGVD